MPCPAFLPGRLTTGPAKPELDAYLRKAFPSATTRPRTAITIHIQDSGHRIFGGIALTVRSVGRVSDAGVAEVNGVGA